MYCPVCEKELKPENKEEVESGQHDGYIYIHKDIPHSETDIEAINTGIQ